MRKLLAAAAVVAAFGAAGTIPSAQAADFPYCMQGRSLGYPGDCQYRSYAECETSASGRGESCDVNPAYAYRQQEQRQQPRQRYFR